MNNQSNNQLADYLMNLRQTASAEDYAEVMRIAIGAVPKANNIYTVGFNYLEKQILDFKETDSLELNPDFQRGHVWTREQQIAYIESLHRGTINESGRLITFNAAHWAVKNRQPDSDMQNMVCVDGLQRLSACLAYLHGEFKVFDHLGGVDIDFFKGTPFDLRRVGNGLLFQVLDLQYKKDVYDFYIAFNKGGTPHSKEEIDKVKNLKMNLEGKSSNDLINSIQLLTI